ncbi:MAG TPA: protealysin inhibitor emfourin [Blastococcus sp.]|nr:protealysin inhibitor emfourin [Blastococcus sp.]
MRIRVRRVGGIAGNIALAAELETASLPADDAARVEGALGGLPWGAPAAEPPHPDAFRYELDLPDEPARGTAILGEAEMEGEMNPLREHLRRAGVVEPGRRRG